MREDIALFSLLLVTLALIWLAYGVATQHLRRTPAWMRPTLEWNLMLWLLLALIYATGWQHWFGA